MLMVETLHNGIVHHLVKMGKIVHGSRIRVGLTAKRHFKRVVVSVSIGIVALPKNFLIFFVPLCLRGEFFFVPLCLCASVVNLASTQQMRNVAAGTLTLP